MSAFTHQHEFCKLITLQICALTYLFFEHVVDVRVTWSLQMQLLVKWLTNWHHAFVPIVNKSKLIMPTCHQARSFCTVHQQSLDTVQSSCRHVLAHGDKLPSSAATKCMLCLSAQLRQPIWTHASFSLPQRVACKQLAWIVGVPVGLGSPSAQQGIVMSLSDPTTSIISSQSNKQKGRHGKVSIKHITMHHSQPELV